MHGKKGKQADNAFGAPWLVLLGGLATHRATAGKSEGGEV
jgi:hypothetical protein